MSGILSDFSSTSAIRFRRRRNIKDILTRYLMAIGGISVIGAIVLIAFYLIYVVLPMFKPAHLELLNSYPLPGTISKTVFYAMEEQSEIALRLTEAGDIIFFKANSGEIVSQSSLLAASGVELTAFGSGDPAEGLLALGLADGSALLLQHKYNVTYPHDKRLITPFHEFPLGSDAIIITENRTPLELISAQYDGEQATIAAVSGSNLYVVNLVKEGSFLSDEVEISKTTSRIELEYKASQLIVDVEQRELFIAYEDGFIGYYDISNKTQPRLIQRVHAVPVGASITSLDFLSGGISILVGDSRGQITQWFPVRDKENNYTLRAIRSFDAQSAPIRNIVPEYFRKGLVAVDDAGVLGIYHATAHRVVKTQQIKQGPLQHVAISPRANAILVENHERQLQFWHVDNEHPEVSWESIWGKVWYESRDKPEYIWQSSSASSDFEPKFSLTPLVFGTLKAAFYAMMFAIPMAICGAIYTAYFMSSRMRGVVKPTIEIMEALPTVILGFLAGLWFAPYVEKHMPGMFLLILLIPASILLVSYLWQSLPHSIRSLVPEGWEAALLIPVIGLAIVGSMLVSVPMEVIFFDGNMPLWIGNALGFDFDQRNSLVVGIAMGFAIIPTIFSISEDAIYSVPKHLSTGSLALGATRWQTMIRVVLLTASPGIFSAIMIGLGRAVGETMIVVMATGNTAIMDMNIFEGFRALSANIAVEIPEAEVGSTHYRILFLAGLVLFAATFVFNTMAEVVRQRLRTKYSTL